MISKGCTTLCNPTDRIISEAKHNEWTMCIVVLSTDVYAFYMAL